jgi:hypothetical protein
MSKENPTPITDDGLKAILADVSAEVDALIQKSEKDKSEVLAKANPGEDISSEPEADTTATKTAPEGSGPEASKPEPEEAPKAAPPTEPEPEMAPEVDPAAEVGPIDPAALKAEYCQLSLDDLQAHYLACKEALVEAMPAQAPAPAAPMAAPAAPAAAPAVAPAAEPPVPAMKSEAELKVEALQKNVKAAEDGFSKLVTVMNKVLNAPLRKSITSMSEVEPTGVKPEIKNMTRAQVMANLNTQIEAGKLNKSETDLIVKFELGKIEAKEIAHLIK